MPEFNETKYVTQETRYNQTFTSYSGCDIVASIKFGENSPPLVLGELQTVSYSIHREVSPIRTIGRINPIGFTGGQRTIAGSLIFTVFDRNIVHEVKELMRRTNYARFLETKRAQKTLSNISLMDEMPPFDIDIIMQNEYGHSSRMIIRGVVIVDEGQVMSIEDILTENTMSYLATDIEVLDLTNQPMSNITTPDASYEDIIDAIIGSGETESSIEKVTIKTLQETESYKHYLGLPISFRGEVYTLYSSNNDIIVYYNYDGKTYYAKVIGDEIANTPGTLEVNEGTLLGLVNVDVDSKIMRIPLVKIL